MSNLLWLKKIHNFLNERYRSFSATYLIEYVKNAQFDYNSQNIKFMPKEIYLKYLEKDS